MEVCRPGPRLTKFHSWAQSQASQAFLCLSSPSPGCFFSHSESLTFPTFVDSPFFFPPLGAFRRPVTNHLRRRKGSAFIHLMDVFSCCVFLGFPPPFCWPFFWGVLLVYSPPKYIPLLSANPSWSSKLIVGQLLVMNLPGFHHTKKILPWTIPCSPFLPRSCLSPTLSQSPGYPTSYLSTTPISLVLPLLPALVCGFPFGHANSANPASLPL